MKKSVLYIFFSLYSVLAFSQSVKHKERFTRVSEVQGKVTFIKELSISNNSALSNYNKLKDWAIINYGKDPFISSVRHDKDNKEFIAKSRIELLLPENSKGVREKMIMRYRINGFAYRDRCVFEITDISYMYGNARDDKRLSHVLRAEDFITDNAVAIADDLQELRINTRKSTLYFLNQVGEDFEAYFAR